MTLEFHGIPVNPGSNHPGEPLLKDLESRTLYRLDGVLNTEAELDKVQWVMGADRMGDLGFHWGDKLTTLDPNGTIAYPGMIIGGTSPLYLILHDDSLVPPGCTPVEKIENPPKNQSDKRIIIPPGELPQDETGLRPYDYAGMRSDRDKTDRID